MWTREFLKTKAKAVLKISYWKAFLVSLVLAIAGGRSSAPSFNFNWNFGHENSYRSSNPFMSTGGDWLPAIIAIILVIVLIVTLVVLAFRIFLGYPLEIGGRRYFLRSAQYDVNMNYLGFAFVRDRYFSIIKTMLWRGLLNFLWFLLLIIPGIVKSYAYSMVPYILADNPNIGYRRAVELSNGMTKGHKFNMWVLDLSFIGWYLLGVLALFVGVLFVLPYDNSTKAELYLVLRQNALDDGICSYEELMIDSPGTMGGMEPI